MVHVVLEVSKPSQIPRGFGPQALRVQVHKYKVPTQNRQTPTTATLDTLDVGTLVPLAKLLATGTPFSTGGLSTRFPAIVILFFISSMVIMTLSFIFYDSCHHHYDQLRNRRGLCPGKVCILAPRTDVRQQSRPPATDACTLPGDSYVVPCWVVN